LANEFAAAGQDCRKFPVTGSKYLCYKLAGDWGGMFEETKSPMYPPEEFLKHAAECKQTAKFTRDPESKATWNQMADRWVRCAELANQQITEARQGALGKRGRSSHF
jgi:hypothetical protein